MSRSTIGALALIVLLLLLLRKRTQHAHLRRLVVLCDTRASSIHEQLTFLLKNTQLQDLQESRQLTRLLEEGAHHQMEKFYRKKFDSLSVTQLLQRLEFVARSLQNSCWIIEAAHEQLAPAHKEAPGEERKAGATKEETARKAPHQKHDKGAAEKLFSANQV